MQLKIGFCPRRLLADRLILDHVFYLIKMHTDM